MANLSSAPPVTPLSVTFVPPATMSAPPAKRPRLSPAAVAPPYYSPHPSFSVPVAESSFDHLPASSAGQMPRAGANAMKAPEKPSDKQAKGAQAKVTDLVELSDIFKDSGVDLREEEMYLYDSYKDPHPATVAAGALPFSQGSTSVPSPGQTFDTWRSSQNATQLTQAAGVSAPFSQPPVSEDEIQALVRKQHLAAATQQSLSEQVHLNDPFIKADSVRERMEARTSEHAVRHRPHGIVSEPVVLMHAARGGNGEGMVATKTLLASDSSLVPLITLISLAARERLRSVLEDSYGTARARVFGSGGTVPPEWTDMASGDGKAENATARPQSLSGTPWDAIPGGAVSPSKRPLIDGQERRPSPPLPPEPQQTVRYSSRLPPLLVDVGTSEVELEQARISARKRRPAAREMGDALGTDGMGSGAATPLSTASAATTPAAPTPPKLTKKERERQAKPVQTEEALRRQSNMTANMQLGGMSKYKWLTAAAGGGAAGGKAAAMSMSPGTGLREKLAAGVLGKRKEDKAKAEPVSADRFKTVGRLMEKPGIQLRDVVGVLELEGGKESKSLAKGYARLQREN